jgi:hypothetical protein
MSFRPVARSLALVPVFLTACAASERAGFEEKVAPAAPEGQEEESSQAPAGEFGKQQPPPSEPEEVHEVYGHSAKTLYKLEPKTKAVTVVGDFKDCEDIIDIALDEKSTLYGVSYGSLYTIDKVTAKCNKMHSGSFPNSLSFIPKGILDPNQETLVGYDKANYVRIDLETGARTVIGNLSAGKGIESSGDIVSVKGGKTFLTVKGGACSAADCLYEIDPATGKKVHDWGSIEHKKVFGLSFWGGKLYGFDEGGNLFEVTFGSTKIVTTTIPIPQKPADLSFWGAGSSTSAPLVFPPS